jgi:hypothetical protein
MFNESLANGHHREGKLKPNQKTTSRKVLESEGMSGPPEPGKCPVHRTGEMAGGGRCTLGQ